MKRGEGSPSSKGSDEVGETAQAPRPSLKRQKQGDSDSEAPPAQAPQAQAQAQAPSSPDALKMPPAGPVGAESSATADGGLTRAGAPSLPSASSPPVAAAASARKPAASATASTHVPAAITAAAMMPQDSIPSKGGPRIRLPDKLIEYLNNEVEQDVLWWQPGGDGFAFDSTTMQSNFLDKHFEGTKLKSFIRSLNRWGFRRIFYATLPKTVYSFHHPLFKKDSPELTRQMKMLSYSGQQAMEMEEFNRQQREGAFSLPGSPQPAPPAAAVPAPPSIPVPQVQPPPAAALAQAAVQQGVAQSLSLLTNPLFADQVLRTMQGQQLLQQQQQIQQQLNLAQLQQQQQQQQQPQQNMAQNLLLQSVINMVQPAQQQQAQAPQQQQQQQQVMLQPAQQLALAMHPQLQQSQQLTIPVLPTNNTTPANNAQMFLPFHQAQQNAALIQYLNSQQRMDSTNNNGQLVGGIAQQSAISGTNINNTSTTATESREEEKERSLSNLQENSSDSTNEENVYNQPEGKSS
ncbi:expressed unknown protein [Seminavis robusta]|uniref:HSF-type DNA-binding domain-containing protein n=1 Tax=Seminavis robusta TaxID=568900 RepID=A0A9N8HQ64_9STRA|nr:expressed unknown protein [Seminavis robusta]|eukprot:Sro1254_g256440.1 n/a (518) ;mRNA; r:25741-27429